MCKLVFIFKKIWFNITTLYYFLLFKKLILNDFLNDVNDVNLRKSYVKLRKITSYIYVKLRNIT